MSDKNINVDISADASGYRKSADEAKKITRDLVQDFDQAGKKISSTSFIPDTSNADEINRRLDELLGKQKQVKEGADQAGAAVSGMSSRMVLAGRVAATAAGLAGAGLLTVGAGALALAGNATRAADEMANLSKKTDLSAESLGAWQLPTAQSGTTLDELADGLKSTAKYLVEHEGNLRKLGITAKTSEGVLIQLAGVLSSMPNDDPRKMALANEVLGDSYQKLMPLLAEGEDGLRKLLERGRELNPVTNQLAREANYFYGQLEELKMSASGLGASLASRLLPHLNDIIKKMNDAARESGVLKSIWVGMKGAFEHAFGIDDMSKARQRLQEIKVELIQINDFLSGNKATAEHTRALIPRLKELGTEKAQLLKLLDPTPPETPRAAPPSDGVLEDILNPPRKEGRKGVGKAPGARREESSIYLDETRDLAELIKEVGKLTEGEKSHIQVLQDKVNAYSSLDPAVKNYLQTTIDQAKTTERLKVFEAESKKFVQENEDLNAKLLESDEKRVHAQLELEHKRSIERIQKLKIESAQVQELIDKENANYQLRIKEADQELEKTDKLSKRLGLSFTSAFENAVVGGEKFGDVVRGLTQDIARLTLRFLLTEKLMGAMESSASSLFPSILKGIGGLLGAFGSFGGASAAGGGGMAITGGGVTGFAAKGAWFDGPVSYFAKGDIFSSPTAFRFGPGGNRLGILGEEDTEAVMPLKRDSSGRLGVMASDGGGKRLTVTYAPTIQVDARTDRAEVFEIVHRAVRQGNADLVDKLFRQRMI